MAKGVLLEVRGRHGVVLTPGGEFKRVPVPAGARVGDEIPLRTELPRRWPVWWVSAAAAVIFAIIGGFVMAPAVPVIAAVTVDINPSVELMVNARGRVVDATALNADGEQLLAAVRVKGRSLEAAVVALTEQAIASGFLAAEDANSGVLISVSTLAADLTEEQEQQLEAKSTAAVRAVIQDQYHGAALVAAIVVTEEQRVRATELGVSVGKYAVSELLAEEYGVTLAAAEIQNLPLGHVYQLLGGEKTLEEVMVKLEKSQNGKAQAARTGKGRSVTAETNQPVADDDGTPEQEPGDNGRGSQNGKQVGVGVGVGGGVGVEIDLNAGGGRHNSPDDDGTPDQGKGGKGISVGVGGLIDITIKPGRSSGKDADDDGTPDQGPDDNGARRGREGSDDDDDDDDDDRGKAGDRKGRGRDRNRSGDSGQDNGQSGSNSDNSGSRSGSETSGPGKPEVRIPIPVLPGPGLPGEIVPGPGHDDD